MLLQIIQCTTVFKVGIWCFADQLYMYIVYQKCACYLFFGFLVNYEEKNQLSNLVIFLYNIEYSFTTFLWIGKIYQFRVDELWIQFIYIFKKIRFDVTLTAFLLFTWVHQFKGSVVQHLWLISLKDIDWNVYILCISWKSSFISVKKNVILTDTLFFFKIPSCVRTATHMIS